MPAHTHPKRLAVLLICLMPLGCDGGGTGEPPSAAPAASAAPTPPAAPPSSPAPQQPVVSGGDSISSPGSGVAGNGAIEVVPARYDLGPIDPGSRHTGTFTIRNASNQPLTLDRAVTNCKCTTTTSVSGRVLAPGETFDFEATLEAPRTPGVKDAKVQLLVRGGLPPVELVVSGDVTMAVRSEPPYVGGPKGGQAAGRLALQSIDGTPFRILSAGGSAPVLVGADDAGDEARTEWTLAWDLAQGPDLDTQAWWVVHTDHPECPVLPLRIRNPKTGFQFDMGRFDRFWHFDENIVNAGLLVAGEAREFDVVIAHYNPRKRGAVENPLWRNVRAVRSLSPELEASMQSVTPISRDELRIGFRVTPRVGFTGPLYALIEIETESGTGAFALLGRVE